MAQLNLLTFTSCTTSIPPNLSPSSYSSSTSLHFPNFHTFSLSSTTPISLFLRQTSHTHHHIIRCSSSNSILTVENPSSKTQKDEDEVSPTRLLAQNVPWSATSDDIRALFQQYGTVVDVELSMHNKNRNRGLAFVEMGSAEEAAQAFEKLEAFEYKGRSLKLAYARPKKIKASPPVQSKPPVVYNLFVANLSFEARAKDIKELFQSCGSEVVSAEVIFNEPRRSSGYGFVSFKTKKEADEALIALQGKEILGRPIRLARSNRFVKLESEVTSETQSEQDSSADSSLASEEQKAADIS